MSTDNKKRFANAIRRIVGWDPTQSELENATKRVSITGKRAIGYYNVDKGSTTAVTGKSGETQLTLGTTLPEDGIIKVPDMLLNPSLTGGNEVNVRDTIRSIYHKEDGVYTMAQLIDNNSLSEADASILGLTNLTNPAEGGGTLNGLNGLFDCETGIELDLRFDGLFTPPDGWENPDTPPQFALVEQKLAGKQWRHRIDAGASLPNIGMCIQSPDAPYATLGEAIENEHWESSPCFLGTKSITEGASNVCLTSGFVSGALVTNNTMQGSCISGESEVINTYHLFELITCTPNGTTCPNEDEISDPDQHWPADGKMQLIWEDGKFKFSDREPVADRVPKYMDNQHSFIDFCFGDGRKGRIQPTAAGGYMIYETNLGVPTGITKIFGSNNKVIGYTDGTGISIYEA